MNVIFIAGLVMIVVIGVLSGVAIGRAVQVAIKRREDRRTILACAFLAGLFLCVMYGCISTLNSMVEFISMYDVVAEIRRDTL